MRINNIYIWFFVLLICVFSVAQAKQTALSDVRMVKDDEKVRLIFGLDKPFKHKIFTLDRPSRVVIDFDNAVLAFPLDDLPFENTGIKSARSGIQNVKNLRVVLDLNTLDKLNVFTLAAQAQYKHRLVVDLHFKSTATPVPTSAPKKDPVLQASMLDKKLRDIVVVVDVGHGGKAPGAVGPKGTLEKNVVLKIAQSLQKALQQEPGIRVVMTRNGDYTVGLRKRLDIARKNNADLFISIHADGFKDPRVRGAGVFALSERGATSEAARWLASVQNYSDLGGVDLDELNDSSGLVRSVLIDLSQTSTIGASLQLGSDILASVKKMAHLHKNHVEQAPFVVLKSPDIPSILVETGFISNAGEEANLGSARYRRNMANAIALGVKNYLWTNAPHDTFIAQQRGRSTYTVVRGDNLSTIARRHGTSIVRIKETNRLSRDALNVGQVLRIPS